MSFTLISVTAIFLGARIARSHSHEPDSSHLNKTISGVGGDCSIPKLPETFGENAGMLVCLDVHSRVGREAKFGDIQEVRRLDTGPDLVCTHTTWNHWQCLPEVSCHDKEDTCQDLFVSFDVLWCLIQALKAACV